MLQRKYPVYLRQDELYSSLNPFVPHPLGGGCSWGESYQMLGVRTTNLCSRLVSEMGL